MRALIVLFSFCMCVINAQAHITITPDSVVEYETSPFEAGFEMIEERYFEKKETIFPETITLLTQPTCRGYFYHP